MTVISKTDVTVLTIEEKFVAEVQRASKEHKEKFHDFLKSLLKLTYDHEIYSVIKFMKIHTFYEGEVITSQGAVSGEFFTIYEGECEAFKQIIQNEQNEIQYWGLQKRRKLVFPAGKFFQRQIIGLDALFNGAHLCEFSVRVSSNKLVALGFDCDNSRRKFRRDTLKELASLWTQTRRRLLENVDKSMKNENFMISQEQLGKLVPMMSGLSTRREKESASPNRSIEELNISLEELKKLPKLPNLGIKLPELNTRIGTHSLCGWDESPRLEEKSQIRTKQERIKVRQTIDVVKEQKYQSKYEGDFWRQIQRKHLMAKRDSPRRGEDPMSTSNGFLQDHQNLKEQDSIMNTNVLTKKFLDKLSSGKILEAYGLYRKRENGPESMRIRGSVVLPSSVKPPQEFRPIFPPKKITKSGVNKSIDLGELLLGARTQDTSNKGYSMARRMEKGLRNRKLMYQNKMWPLDGRIANVNVKW